MPPNAVSPHSSPVPESSPVDVQALRKTLGQFATGVTVIAARAADGALVGLTANSFGALSLDPPLIVWALRKSSPSLPVFEGSDRFVVSVLAEAQVEVSRRFASHAPDKFDGVAHALNEHGVPFTECSIERGSGTGGPWARKAGYLRSGPGANLRTARAAGPGQPSG